MAATASSQAVLSHLHKKEQDWPRPRCQWGHYPGLPDIRMHSTTWASARLQHVSMTVRSLHTGGVCVKEGSTCRG